MNTITLKKSKIIARLRFPAMNGKDREMTIELFKDFTSHPCTLPVSKEDLALLSDMPFYPVVTCGECLADACDKAWEKRCLSKEEVNSLFLFVWVQRGLEGVMDELEVIEKSLHPRKMVYGIDYNDNIKGIKLLFMTSRNQYPKRELKYMPNLEIVEDGREMIIQETIGVVKIENEKGYEETILY